MRVRSAILDDCCWKPSFCSNIDLPSGQTDRGSYKFSEVGYLEKTQN